MEWMSTLQQTVNYIENHLRDTDLKLENLSKQSFVSSGYLQKGFSILTGVTITEYIRNRRLYLAALDIHNGQRVIDVALDYGYDTPDSFTKAFSRFHGTTPREIKNDASKIKIFMPFVFNIAISGGNNIEAEIMELPAFRVIGYTYNYDFTNSYNDIAKLWEEFTLMKEKGKERDIIEKYMVGAFGVCIDDSLSIGTYMIAGEYKGGDIPDGMTVYEIPQMTWARFRSIGPLPGALQSVNTEIYRNWLPSNGKYDLAGNLDIEWYSPEGKTSDLDYKAEIWLPVKAAVK